MEIAGLNADLQQEYARQREHLEHNLATLRKKVTKENELHRSDYVRIMQVRAPHGLMGAASPGTAQAHEHCVHRLTQHPRDRSLP